MTTSPSSSALPAAGGRTKILIVEDEPDIARGLRDALDFEGFDVSTVGTGARGHRHRPFHHAPIWSSST